jgi:PAS domain S-box-containing protein
MGEGSTFTVSIPLGTEHLPAGSVASAGSPMRLHDGGRDYVEQALRWLPDGAEEGESRSAALLVAPELLGAGAAAQRARIVLADDNADMRDYVRRLLSATYEVVPVADGREALQAVATHQPDLVLTDVMMPNVDGFGLLHALRSDPATAAIPVIMLSARAGEEARVEGLHAGADDYVVKPFTARELLARVGGMLAVARVRREANEALRESEERYRSLVQATAAIVWSTPRSGQFLSEQPSWSAFTGQTAEQQQGWGWLAAIHPDDRAKTTDVWEAALANPGRTEIEHRVRRADGQYRHMAARAVPVIDEHGEIREWIGAHTDVTSERRLQQELENERVRLREIFLRAPAFIAMLRGPEHRFEVANPPYMHLVGDRPSIIGKPIREVLPELKDQGFFQLLDGVYSTGQPYLGNEVRVLLERNGAMEERFLNFLYEPVRDAEGRVDGVFVHAVDVTEQVRARQQVERQADELAAADRRKDEFMATLSHELRTPLTAILGWARILKMDHNDEATIRTAIDTIDQSAQVQAQLIDDVLDISRITTGKVRIDAAATNVATVAASALDGVRLAAEAKGILLQSDFAPTGQDRAEPLILGDANRLQQIIWNLLTNAIKFTPGGGEVRLEVRQGAESVSLTVTDTGIGIAPEFMPHIFEPFRQAESPSTRIHGGLGLGLSIVRYLVELHGGQITAASDGERKGAAFTVEFPRLRRRSLPAAAVVSRTNVVAGPGQPETADLADLSVLIVDDQPAIRDYLMAVLRRSGAEARAVSSVQEAIRAVQHELPDVVLCDIAMPHEDGFVFLDWIRSIPARRRVAVLAVTALGRSEDEQRMIGAGFDGYVRKPVEPATLTRAVAAARNGRG